MGARAWLCGGNWTDGAYRFGAPAIAEAVGTAEEIGAELTRFLDSLEWEDVEAARIGSGPFTVQVEVEHHEGSAPWLARRAITRPQILSLSGRHPQAPAAPAASSAPVTATATVRGTRGTCWAPPRNWVPS